MFKTVRSESVHRFQMEPHFYSTIDRINMNIFLIQLFKVKVPLRSDKKIMQIVWQDLKIITLN